MGLVQPSAQNRTFRPIEGCNTLPPSGYGGGLSSPSQPQGGFYV